MRVDLPRWYFVLMYSVAAVSFTHAEVIAAWFDRDSGDTLTEMVRPTIQSNAVGWVLAGLFLTWLLLHFVLPKGG